jgi:hypothetical protein
MKICFLIPDGVGIRNYLYSDVVKGLIEQGHEVIVWHSLGKDLILQVKKYIDVDFEDFDFIHRPEAPIVKFIRESAVLARLRKNREIRSNPTILSNWNPSKKGWKNKIFYKGVEIVSNYLKDFSAISKWEEYGFEKSKSGISFQEAKSFLQEQKPDILFCTHQRVPSVTSALMAAKAIGIKTYTAIFSWDNLPKARLPFRTDKYLVWSQYMKNELLTYYPDINENQIEITSTPQFDFYRKKELIYSREEFAQKYGLNPTRKWVCYSGSDSISSPHDPDYLEQIARALRQNENVQLIFREVPVESNKRFQKVFEKHPEIINISPEWVKSSQWGSFFPMPSDIRLLVNLAYHCNVVINLGSTMALDFAVFNSNGLYLRYDQPYEKERLVKHIYNYEHFSTMKGLDPVGWIDAEEDILSKVNSALERPESIGPDRLKWFHRIVEPDKNHTSSERIVRSLTQ